MRYLFPAGILLVSASFPYIAVGQVLADDAWLGRNNILTPLGLSLLITGILIKLATALFPSVPKLWLPGVFVVCITWAAASAVGYARLQAFGIKQASAQKHLRHLIHKQSPAVIQIRDYVTLRGGIPYYPQLIWTAMAACCDGSPGTLVFDSRPFVRDEITTDSTGQQLMKVGSMSLCSDDIEILIQQSTVSYALNDIPRTGRQFVMAFHRPNDSRSEERIGIDYLRKRWLGDSGGSGAIDSFVQAQIFELPPVSGRN